MIVNIIALQRDQINYEVKATYKPCCASHQTSYLIIEPVKALFDGCSRFFITVLP